MAPIPEMVTHLYDPVHGACLNMCSLPDSQALQVLDRLRRQSRPNLKPDYLSRRRAAEEWLFQSARKLLARPLSQSPVYLFLGDFSYCADPSRPASLVFPLAALPADSITFTLGDSMKVAEQPDRRVFKLEEIVALFEAEAHGPSFPVSDRSGYQNQFIEVQAWDRSFLLSQLPNILPSMKTRPN